MVRALCAGLVRLLTLIMCPMAAFGGWTIRFINLTIPPKSPSSVNNFLLSFFSNDLTFCTYISRTMTHRIKRRCKYRDTCEVPSDGRVKKKDGYQKVTWVDSQPRPPRPRTHRHIPRTYHCQSGSGEQSAGRAPEHKCMLTRQDVEAVRQRRTDVSIVTNTSPEHL